MEHILCRLWITMSAGISHSKLVKLREDFGSLEEIYSLKNFNNIKYLSEKDKSRLKNKSLDKAKAILEATAKLNAKILAFDNDNYPEILRHIQNPPEILYIQGKVPELDKVLTIGIVGTRRATEHGIIITERFSRYLAKAGVVTVSGLASGIDAAGAWAALEAGGMSVGVIGNGLDVVYPSENAELYKSIAERGCIMTEYPPGTPPVPRNFPVRNRIIAGISRGILVTEAPERSGSLITARLALENNRDVFSVPRDISKIKLLGTNLLIQQGAKLVNNPNDILCEYPYFEKVAPIKGKEVQTPEKTAVHTKEQKNEKIENLKDKDKKIAELLLLRDMQIDEIARELNISVQEVNRRMTMLEMTGIVKKLGTQYRLKG